MQVKTTVSYQLTPIRMTVTKNLTSKHVGKNAEKREAVQNPCALSVGLHTAAAAVGNSVEIRRKNEK